MSRRDELSGLVVAEVVQLLATLGDDARVADAMPEIDGTNKSLSKQKVIAAYLEAARERVREAAEYDPLFALGLARVRLADCYRRAIDAMDIKSALSALRELHRIEGLGPLKRKHGGAPPDSKDSPMPPVSRPAGDPLDRLRVIPKSA